MLYDVFAQSELTFWKQKDYISLCVPNESQPIVIFCLTQLSLIRWPTLMENNNNQKVTDTVSADSAVQSLCVGLFCLQCV